MLTSGDGFENEIDEQWPYSCTCTAQKKSLLISDERVIRLLALKLSEIRGCRFCNTTCSVPEVAR